MNKKNQTPLQKLRKEAGEAKTSNNRNVIKVVLQQVYERKAIAWREIEALTKIHTSLEAQRSDIDSSTLFPTDEDITVEKVMALNWEEVEGKLHSRICDWFGQFRYVYQNGYISATNQLLIKTVFYKDEPVESQIAQVMQFIPHLNLYELNEKDGFGPHKIIDIMDYMCSEYATYSIYIRPNNKASLIMMRNGQFSIVEEFKDVESCLRYVHQNHPYELPESDSKETKRIKGN